MPASLKLPRFLLLALFAATTNAETDNDVPGCACQANTTCEPTDMIPDTLACALYIDFYWNDPRFQDKVEQPVALCDGLEADPAFQDTVGNESRLWFRPNSIGPYYETGSVVMQLAYGTCEDLIAKQNSCPVDGLLDESIIGYSRSIVEPNGCSTRGWTLPRTNSTQYVSLGCESFFPDKNIKASYEDSIFMQSVLVTEMDSGDLNLCKADDAAKYPALTRADWIEPKAGSSRRYISHDIVDVDGTEYCLLVMSIGNEHCRGPLPAPSSQPTPASSSQPTPASSSHTTNGRHVVLFALFGQLALAVLSWVL